MKVPAAKNCDFDGYFVRMTGEGSSVRQEDRVFGTVFELQGDVATPFQFYLTDSTDQFIYAEILFNSRPNYDSLKPSLDYLKKDLDTLLNTFKWPKQ